MTAVPWVKVRAPLLAIVVAAVGLIGARMIWPRLYFDTTSLILFGIAAVAWALAYVPVTKLKWGDFEAELAPMVAALEQKVIACEVAATARAVQGTGTQPGVVMRGDPLDGRAAELGASALYEEFRAIVGPPAPDADKVVRAAALLERLVHEGRIRPPASEAVGALRTVRDEIVAGRTPLTPELANRILELAWRLLKTVGR